MRNLLFAALAVFVTPVLAAGHIPPAVHTFEEAVEDLQELPPKADAGSRVDGALQKAPAARKALEAAKASPEVLSSFDAALESLKKCRSCDRTDLQVTATDLSLVLFDAFEVFHPARPTDLARIDVLSVRVPLELERNQTDAAARRAAELSSFVARLEPQVPASGKAHFLKMKAEAGHLEQAVRGKDKAGAHAAAKEIGALVDRLEKVFPE